MFAVGNVPDFSIISCLTNRLQQSYADTTVFLPQHSGDGLRPFYFLMPQTRASPNKNIMFRSLFFSEWGKRRRRIRCAVRKS